MRQDLRVALLAVAGLATLLAGAPAASAEEYRLRVASVHEQGFYAYLKPGELRDGVSGPGLDRLERSLDSRDFPSGALIGGRDPAPARESVARVWGGVPVRIEPAGESATHRWAELRWQGKPGERSVFVIDQTAGRPQDVVRVALRGTGPLRQYQVYEPPGASARLAAVRMQLAFLWAAQERGDVWTKYVAPVLDLAHGIGVVVGANAGGLLADHVYLIVTHAERATTYEAVLAWRQSPDDRQAPSDNSRRLF